MSMPSYSASSGASGRSGDATSTSAVSVGGFSVGSNAGPFGLSDVQMLGIAAAVVALVIFKKK